jgi:phosphoenolpyruvate carboxylase
MAQQLASEDQHDALRRDIRLLGFLLGRVLVEQEGEDFLLAEERLRLSARDSRATGDTVAVREAVDALSPADQGRMQRAFALYFQLANIAEQHHRVRRRRTYASEERIARE